MNQCPGCLKAGAESFCTNCRKRLFDGKKVSHILPFSRPTYDKVKREITPERMSISGIQTKISLELREGRLQMVPSGGHYILKPRPNGPFEHLDMAPINEHLTMQIARQVFDIQVAENALVQFEDGEFAYLVRRFDVRADGQRALQEDFAQISQRSEESHGPHYKYDGSYEEIGELIRRYVATYPVDLERFFTLVVFNYLINNGDAHAKNFSLIRDENGEYNLTPAYDLLNTRIHLRDENRTALELFKDSFETASFQANAYFAFDDFMVLAQRLGLVERRVKRIMERFINAESAIHELIGRSQLNAACQQLYREYISDRVRALSYSHANQRG